MRVLSFGIIKNNNNNYYYFTVSFTFHFWYNSFTFDDVKFAELSNSFESKNVTF